MMPTTASLASRSFRKSNPEAVTAVLHILLQVIQQELIKRCRRSDAPKDISDTVRFLLTEESSWMTGQVLAVDGGLSRIRLLT